MEKIDQSKDQWFDTLRINFNKQIGLCPHMVFQTKQSMRRLASGRDSIMCFSGLT